MYHFERIFLHGLVHGKQLFAVLGLGDFEESDSRDRHNDNVCTKYVDVMRAIKIQVLCEK